MRIAGVYRVDGYKPVNTKRWQGFIYNMEQLPKTKRLDGRIIVDFPKSFRTCYLRGENYEHKLKVVVHLKKKLQNEEQAKRYLSSAND